MLRFGLGWCCDELCRYRAAVARRPENWKPAKKGPSVQTRTNVKRRDGERCRYCGSADSLTIHHVLYRSEGGDHNERNLITLCRTHHDMVHSSKYRWQPVLVEVLRLHYEEQTFTNPVAVDKAMRDT